MAKFQSRIAVRPLCWSAEGDSISLLLPALLSSGRPVRWVVYSSHTWFRIRWGGAPVVSLSKSIWTEICICSVVGREPNRHQGHVPNVALYFCPPPPTSPHFKPSFQPMGQGWCCHDDKTLCVNSIIQTHWKCCTNATHSLPMHHYNKFISHTEEKYQNVQYTVVKALLLTAHSMHYH